jgi:hypothetical protein
VTGQLSNLEDQPDPELVQVLDQLSRRFPHLSEPWLHELARTVHEGFRDAPIRTFVPLLVEHQVVGAVRRTSALSVVPAAPLPPPTPLRRHGREIGAGRDEISPEAAPAPDDLPGGAGRRMQRRSGPAMRTSWWHSLTRPRLTPTWPQSSPSADEAGALPD